MSYLCVICARKGSKGLKDKNIKKINGISLTGHTLLQAKKSKLFTKIVVSSDSSKIRNISKKFGVKSWFSRPKHLSSDTIGKNPVIIHALKAAEKYYQTRYPD